jgi:GntR family transcriptional regulator, rspAB operon transcriptional repressor
MKQRAYTDILGRILDGRYLPGHLLNRRGVAQELRMSAAPVHEAMIELECAGFVEALPRLGTRVRHASVEDLRGHLIIREALECQAARMICGDPVGNRLETLRPLAFAADSTKSPYSDRARHEVEFHIALVEIANCPALLREYRRVMQIGLFYRINLLMPMPSGKPHNLHVSLLEELRTGTPDAAARAVRRHLWSGKPDALKA